MIFRTVNGVCRSASCREDFLRVGIYCKYLFEAIMYLHKNVSIDMTLYHGGYSSQEERDLWE